MLKKIIVLFTFILFSLTGVAQKVLQNYIDSALENNIVLKQKNISFQKADLALKSAKSLFYPTVNIQADYTFANGGRDIDLPIGDMLNGVYSTLNSLTQTQKFPQLENQHINFLPNNFYDVKLHTEVPIINSQLGYNKKIKSGQIRLSRFEIDSYKRSLVEKVKTAYYQYIQALDAIDIYQSALNLATENKRVSESLLKNGKGLPAYVLRSESEIENVKSEKVEAQQQADNAKRYFNFLLNKKQEAPIDTAISTKNKMNEVLTLLTLDVHVSDREELKAIREAQSIKQDIYKMNKAAFYPTLNGFLDLGSQAENWKFDSQSRYFMTGIRLKIPIFEGMRNRLKLQQAELSVKDTRLDARHLTQQLKLEGKVAQNNLKAAYQKFLSSKKQLKAAAAYHRLIKKGYQKGTNTYIETIDARNQLTKAQLAVSINTYKTLEARARLERALGNYSF